MDVPHKQVMTTYPIALKFGQTRLHVPDPIPWHAHSENIQCPECETRFIVTSGFPKAELLETLEKHHKNKEEHPDLIPSAPEWTSICECRCGR